jgi:peptide/nickel transport system substrate-binding protein
MRSSFKVIATIVLLSMVLSACGTPAATSTSNSEPIPPTQPASNETTVPAQATAAPESTSSTSAAKNNKTLTVHLYEDIQNVDPAFYPSDADESIMSDVYQGLVGWKPGSFDIENVLADEITKSADGKEIDFKLREGVQFHHGYGELTAEDVKFSYERLIDPNLKAVYASDWAALDHVEVTGKYTGKIILKDASAPLWVTTLPGTSGYILSKKAVEEKGNDGIATFPVGTGPYEFQEWKPNAYVKETLFKDYWGTKPEWETIVHQYIPEESSVDIALETGELDFGRVSPSSVERFQNNTKFQVIAVPSLDWEVLFMNVQHPLLKDPNVRKAIRSAIDVDSINQAVYEGKYQPLCNMMTPQMIGYWKDATCYKRDVEKAKAYLTQSGVTNLELHLAIQNTEDEKAVGEIIQANLADIGIKVDLDIEDDSTFTEEGFGPDAVNKRQLVYLNWINYPDPSLTTTFFKCDQVTQWNWMYYCNPEFDKLNDAAVQEMDPQKRADMYIEMQKMIDDEAGSVFVSNIVLYYVARNGIQPSITPHGRVWAWDFKSAQ